MTRPDMTKRPSDVDVDTPPEGTLVPGPWLPDVPAPAEDVAAAEGLPVPRPAPGEPVETYYGEDEGPVAYPGHRVEGSATSYEVLLDDEPEPSRLYVDIGAAVGVRLPVIPPEFRWHNLPSTIRRALDRAAHRALFHAVRVPWYCLLTVVWSVVGAGRVVARQVGWWWLSEQRALRLAAVEGQDAATWMKLHDGLREVRRTRALVLVAEAIGTTTAAAVLWFVAPRIVLVPVVVVVVLALARAGRPQGRPIVKPAIVEPRFRKLTSDIVLRAYYAARLGDPEKSGQQIEFGTPMARDASNTGSQVTIDLPYGKTFDDAVKVKGAIASGLDVSVNQVFLTTDPSSHRRHGLFVADRDPLAIPAGRTPLLDCKPRDIWRPAPFGLDERGKRVDLALMWISVLIGAQPRKGKTFAARLLALYAALDPHVTLFVVDGKNSPDWSKFALVADVMVHGTHPGPRDPDPVGRLLDLLRRMKKHIQRVNDVLSGLPVELAEEGKLTRELARDRRFPDLRVWVLVMEEFQVYYELDDTDESGEIASLLSFIKAVGPSAGVIIISSSQKPSGIGAGANIQKLFTRYRDNHDARFALKCGNRVVSEAILGGDAYAEGYDASALPTGDKYRGVGYLYGLTDHTPTVRTYLADGGDAERILLAARRHRQAAGTLSGMAAGEVDEREVRDVLADVRAVFNAGETGLQWPAVAERLADRIPEHYADITAEAISAQLRALGVPSVDVKRDGRALKGAKLAEVTAAADRREIRR